MAKQTIHQILKKLRQASQPEDVFGKLTADLKTSLQAKYRVLAHQTHPDHHAADKTAATEAFRLLQKWHWVAKEKIGQNAYGKEIRIDIETIHFHYRGHQAPINGDICDLYPASPSGKQVLLKVVRRQSDNKLMRAEAKAIKRIRRTLQGEAIQAHFPTLVESFQLLDGAAKRQINVFERESDSFTLAEVLRAYPNGIHPADMAWMFNRTLAALGATHAAGMVHGALIPEHIMIRPADHNGMLLDFCYSVQAGEPLQATTARAQDYYAPEILANRPVTCAADLYMAALCMVRLLGGNVVDKTVPAHVPKPIVALLKACLIPSPHRRFDDAWTVFGEFREILERVYGRSTFRPFNMEIRD